MGRTVRTDPRFPVVALVCSSGGLDALTRVLSPLPADFPAAIVILQHTTPDMESHLAAILDQRTNVHVQPAAQGQQLRPGQAVTVPSGHHALITTAGVLELIASGAIPPYRPSADLLLSTLALAAGPKAIAVILTGRGNDGATGASAVHHFHGVVIVTDEDSSREFAMPQATLDRPNVVDHIVPLDNVAGLLQALTAAPTLLRPPSDVSPYNIT